MRNRIVIVDIAVQQFKALSYKQYDANNILQIVVMENKKIVDITPYTITIYFKLPSGKIYRTIGVIKNNTINVTLSSSVLKEYGKVILEVELSNSKEIVTTFSMYLNVEKSIDGSESSDTEDDPSLEDIHHTHKNKEVLDQITQEMIDNLIEGGGFEDLIGYQKKEDIKLNTIDKTIVGAINELNEKIENSGIDGSCGCDKHTHNNKNVLDGITESKIQEWNNKSDFDGNYNSLTNKPTIPTKTSQLQNDSDFATNASVDEKIANVSTGGQVDLSSYAKKTDLPTKTSQLTNDSNFLTSVPSEYVTESELNAKDYLTSVPSEYITETELNARRYLTEHQDISGKVDKINGKGLSTNDYTTEEKNKLNGIEENANNYSLPIASSNTLGGIKVGSGLSIDSNGVLSSSIGSSDLSNYQTKTDNALTTTDKTIVGAINELDIEGVKAEDFEDSFVIIKNNLTSRVSTLETNKADKSEIPTRTSQLTNDSSFLTSIPSEYVTDTDINDIVLNVKMHGVLGNGEDETTSIQTIIDNAPIGSTILFPAGCSFSFSTLNINKHLIIYSVGATLTQSSNQNAFINVTSNDARIYGGNYVVQGTNGISLNGNNNRVYSVNVSGGEHSILIQGNNAIVEDCTTESATYAGFKINFAGGDKRDCVTVRNCTSKNSAYKGIVYNGTVGVSKIIIEKFKAITDSTITASDGILIDCGNDSLFCIDDVIIDDAYIYGGESNAMKLYNMNNLTLRNIYARNEHSQHSSSSGIRVYGKKAYLENIDIDNRIIANEDIKINGLYFSSNEAPYSVIELTGGGTIADFNNINLSITSVGSYAIRVSRNSGVQHKIILDNYNAPTNIKIFGIFTYPPSSIGFIEVLDKKLLSGYNISGSTTNDNRIIRSPRTFVSTECPTSGSYIKGDIIYNSSVTSDSSIGWVCTQSKTDSSDPVFKSFGADSSSGIKSQSDSDIILQSANGTTSARPTNNLYIGLMYFDTTLNKPIWYNGTTWVDANGTTV